MKNSELVAISMHQLKHGDIIVVMSACCQKVFAKPFVGELLNAKEKLVITGKVFTLRARPTICGFVNSFAAANGMVYGGVSLAFFPLTDIGGGIGFYCNNPKWIRALMDAKYEPKSVKSREALELFSSPDYGKSFSNPVDAPKLFHLPGKRISSVEFILQSCTDDLQILPECRVLLKPEMANSIRKIAA